MDNRILVLFIISSLILSAGLVATPSAHVAANRAFASPDTVAASRYADQPPGDPLQYGSLYPPQPTGIASFGVYDQSGNIQTYDTSSSEVVGTADISSISAYNSTAGLTNSSVSGATLQLNSVLVVQDRDGSRRAYWSRMYRRS